METEDINQEKQTAKLQEKHSKIIQCVNRVITNSNEEREQNLQDRRFASIAGAQWEGDLSQYYENRPKIEINKIALACEKNINEYRSNRITVKFASKNGMPSELADTCNDLFRADEQDSNATEAYDNTYEDGIKGGYSALRLSTQYEDEYDDDNDQQRITILPIFDADKTAFFDEGAKRYDKADAKWVVVMQAIPKVEFEDEYGEVPATMNTINDSDIFDWYQPDVVYIGEYFEIELINHTVKIFKNALGDEQKLSGDDFEEDEEELLATGFKLIKEKKVKKRKVHKYIISGDRILEDCGLIAGTELPVVPFCAKRTYIDNIERTSGIVRFTKDAQILKNIQMSNLAEISSLFKQEKPIVAPEQVQGLSHFWENDNIKNYKYLPLNPIIDETTGQQIAQGPLAYTKPPSIPPALAALLTTSEQDLQDLLGRNVNLQDMTNLSGDAISKLLNDQDIQNSLGMSNFVKTIQRVGQVWLGMAREIYVEDDRVMRAVGEDGKDRQITLNQLGTDDNEMSTVKNDLSKANFNVVATVGASTSSKREATVKNILQAMQATSDPETQTILSNLLVMNMDGEGFEDIRTYIRKKLLRAGVLPPTEEEKQELLAELEAQQTPAEAQYLESLAREAEANAQNKNADTIKKLTDADKTQAETEEIYQDMGIKQNEQISNLVNNLVNNRLPVNPQSGVTVPPLNETGEI